MISLAEFIFRVLQSDQPWVLLIVTDVMSSSDLWREIIMSLLGSCFKNIQKNKFKTINFTIKYILGVFSHVYLAVLTSRFTVKY